MTTAALILAVLGCSSEETTKAPKSSGQPAKDAAGVSAADKSDAASDDKFIKAQLNDRLITFSKIASAENYLAGSNFRLRAETSDGESFEIVGEGVLPNPRKFPVVIKAGKNTKLTFLYSTGLPTEWIDEAGTLRIESYQDGILSGSFNSERLRPTKPALPIRISGGIFELPVPER